MTFDHSFAIRGRFTSPPAFPCQLSTINKPPVPRLPSPVFSPPPLSRDHHRINSVSENSNRLKSVGVVVRVLGPPVSPSPVPGLFHSPRAVIATESILCLGIQTD